MKAEIALAAARGANRVLADYPLAQRRLAAHAGKRCRVELAAFALDLRVTPAGLTEPIGEGADSEREVTIFLPLAALAAAPFDREAAIARTRFTGDIAAHRVADTGRRLAQWRRDAGSRLADNLAEYLTEELRAFLTHEDLESLTRETETLRDDVARLEARLHLLDAPAPR